MKDWLEWLAIFCMSGFKYILANVMAMALGLSFLSAFLVTVCGGLFGVLVFILFGEAVRALFFLLYPRARKKTSWKFRRRIITIRNYGGILGIALLTPPLFMVPGGVFISMALGYKWHKIVLAMGVSFCFWSAMLLLLYNQVSDYISPILNKI